MAPKPASLLCRLCHGHTWITWIDLVPVTATIHFLKKIIASCDMFESAPFQNVMCICKQMCSYSDNFRENEWADQSYSAQGGRFRGWLSARDRAGFKDSSTEFARGGFEAGDIIQRVRSVVFFEFYLHLNLNEIMKDMANKASGVHQRFGIFCARGWWKWNQDWWVSVFISLFPLITFSDYIMSDRIPLAEVEAVQVYLSILIKCNTAWLIYPYLLGASSRCNTSSCRDLRKLKTDIILVETNSTRPKGW